MAACQGRSQHRGGWDESGEKEKRKEAKKKQRQQAGQGWRWTGRLNRTRERE